MHTNSINNSPVKYVALGFLVLFFSCKNDPSISTNQHATVSEDQTEYQNGESPNSSSKDNDAQDVNIEHIAKDLVYSWVDKLNIRSAPNTSGKVVLTVQSDDALQLTGDKSDQSETIVLRGVAYDDHWFKVITPDKKEGWVFGGAVKLPDEAKGNEVLSETNFRFPYFGTFDLSDWTKLSDKDESGGDASIITTTYKRKNQYLEVSKVDIGGYGYERSYKLMDENKKVLKERALKFSADMELRELRETVIDYTKSPAKEYSRTQQLKKHHSQLNSLPLMVNGNWIINNE